MSSVASYQETATHQASMVDFLRTVYQERRLIAAVTFGLGLISLATAFLLPRWYLATAKLMPPQQTQSSALAMLSQVGALVAGSAAGQASQALGLRNPSEIYVAMLKSRTVADAIIDRFKLKELYGRDTMTDTRKELARNATISAGREGIITIEVEDKSPERAAEMANAYAQELDRLTQDLAVSEAGQRRKFFEQQLAKAKDELVKAEVDLKKFSTESGLVSLPNQLGATVATAAAIRAQIAAREIMLTSMRSFSTENNPDIKRVSQELVGLRRELGKLESDSGSSKGDVLLPAGRASSVGLEYIRLARDLKYRELLLDVLAKQYEIARIDEAKDAAIVQVLEKAIPPDTKSKPLRTLIVSLGLFLGMFSSIVFIFARQRFRALKNCF